MKTIKTIIALFFVSLCLPFSIIGFIGAMARAGFMLGYDTCTNIYINLNKD